MANRLSILPGISFLTSKTVPIVLLPACSQQLHQNPCQVGQRRGRHSDAPNCPPRCEYGDHEHDRRFHQFGHSRPESRDNPQRANGSKHEACAEYEREIEHTSSHNPDDSLLPLSAPPIVATLPRASRLPLDMSSIHPECPDSGPSDWSVAADVVLRQEPDEKDKEEDEGGKEDDNDDDTDDGSSSASALHHRPFPSRPASAAAGT
jgi:hypothetical protein